MAEKLLSYDAVSQISYRADDIAVILSPAQQSLAVQAISLFTGGDLWQDYEANADAIDALAADTMNALQVPVVNEFGQQSRVTFWHRWTDVGAGNPLQVVVDATVLWGHYVRQNPNADGEQTTQKVWLPAGDYQIRVLYFRLTNNGRLRVIMERDLDLQHITALNNIDLFGTTLANQVATGSFTLTQPGSYTVYWKANGKNASSTAFALPLTVTEIWKVSD